LRRRERPREPYSQESKEHLTGLIYDKVVEIKNYGLDSYGRTMEEVYLDGNNINIEIGAEGGI
jgi:endonuclease YncB( thermonuclease family)